VPTQYLRLEPIPASEFLLSVLSLGSIEPLKLLGSPSLPLQVMHEASVSIDLSLRHLLAKLQEVP